MPFSYYARLTRSQQAVYRRSDEIAAVRLAQPTALHPAVTALTSALATEDRAQHTADHQTAESTRDRTSRDRSTERS